MRLPNWYRNEENGVRFYRAWNLHASGMVAHGFSTRVGGSSKGEFATLNLGLSVPDDPASVLANRCAFAEAIGVDPNRIVVPAQVHSANVRLVTEADAGSGAVDHSTAIPETDALITNTPNLPLTLHFADCGCVFLLDPEHRAIGVVHAGWRGTALKIVSATVEAMSREFGTDPAALQAAIGPSICRHCYDVGEDVAREMFAAFPHDDRVLSQFSNTKWRVDIKTANAILLREAGVPDANIAISTECTSCNRTDFFSYRRDGPTGRMGGYLEVRG